MIRSLLVRGMLVGVFAGLLAFAVAYVLGEPQVQHAIDFEDLIAARHGVAPEHEVVSRGVQRTLGLLTGTVAIGVACGGLFALAFAYAYGRVPVPGARATAALIALGAFVVVTLVPFTKYPASPPSVGDPATLDRRTLLAFAMVAIAAAALLAAVRIGRQLRPRLGIWDASLAAGAAFIVLVGVAQLMLPAVHETPAGFPADVLYRFRVASLAIGATLWLTIGAVFGVAADRLLRSGVPPGTEIRPSRGV